MLWCRQQTGTYNCHDGTFFFFKLIYRNDCLTPKGRDLCVHGHLAALSLVHTHLHWREGSEPGWPAVPEGPTVAWWRSWCRGGSTPRPLWTRAHRQGADPLGSADTRGPGLSDAPYGPAGPAGFPLDESRFRLGTGLTPPEAPGFQHPGNNPPPPAGRPSEASVCQSMLSRVQSQQETNVSGHIKARRFCRALLGGDIKTSPGLAALPSLNVLRATVALEI